MMRMYFGIGVGNAILAPIGFMGPGNGWPGIFAGALAIGAFVVLGIIYKVDEHARMEFMSTLAKFRIACVDRDDLEDRIDTIQGMIMRHEPLVQIAHEIGQLNGELRTLGLLPDNNANKPQVDI